MWDFKVERGMFINSNTWMNTTDPKSFRSHRPLPHSCPTKSLSRLQGQSRTHKQRCASHHPGLRIPRWWLGRGGEDVRGERVMSTRKGMRRLSGL